MNVYLNFVDFERVADTINRNEMCQTLKTFPEKYTRIKFSY